MTVRDPALNARGSQPDSGDLWLFLGIRFFATLGVQIQAVAVGWQVYDISGSPTALGLVGLSQFLPMVLMVLPAGDLADRFDRRFMLMASYGVQGLASALLITLSLMGVHDVWPFYGAAALFGVALGLSQPAMQSILPFLVTADRLPQAIAWGSSANLTAIIGGPAVGGLLLPLGPLANYGLCLVLFLGASIVLLSLRLRRSSEAPSPGTAMQRILDGIGYIFRRPILLGAISLDLFAMLLGTVTGLLPIFARDILHVGPTGLGFLRSATAIGAALVAFALARWPLQRHTGAAMYFCVALFGAAMIVFGLSWNFYLSFFTLVLAGAADMVSVYIRSALAQLATPDNLRGRVGSVSSLFVGASNQLGDFRSGVSAGLFGAVPAVVMGGIGTLAVVALWMWLFPPLHRVDRFSEVVVR